MSRKLVFCINDEFRSVTQEPSDQSFPFFHCHTIKHWYTDFRSYLNIHKMWVFAQRVKLYLKLPLCELVTSIVHVLLVRWFIIVGASLWCHEMSWDVMWCHVMSCDVMWCHVLSWDVMRCHEMSCDVMRCHEMSWCHVMWWDVMWCHVMSCDTMWHAV